MPTLGGQMATSMTYHDMELGCPHTNADVNARGTLLTPTAGPY
jgi:hypothetical protein